MRMDDIKVGTLENIQRAANETMTRVIFFDNETVGNVDHERMLIVVPLSLEITVDDDDD